MLIFFDLVWILMFVVTLVALWLAATLQQLTGLPFLAVLWFGSGAWALWDGLRIPLKNYESPIAYGPIRLFIALFILWPYGFSWYLAMKYKIARGTAKLKATAR